jgi:hypothetical protein
MVEFPRRCGRSAGDAAQPQAGEAPPPPLLKPGDGRLIKDMTCGGGPGDLPLLLLDDGSVAAWDVSPYEQQRAALQGAGEGMPQAAYGPSLPPFSYPEPPSPYLPSVGQEMLLRPVALLAPGSAGGARAVAVAAGRAHAVVLLDSGRLVQLGTVFAAAPDAVPRSLGADGAGAFTQVRAVLVSRTFRWIIAEACNPPWNG